jgi:hypothetical protein
MTYPILEHDPARTAFVEPSTIIAPRDMLEHWDRFYMAA